MRIRYSQPLWYRSVVDTRLLILSERKNRKQCPLFCVSWPVLRSVNSARSRFWSIARKDPIALDQVVRVFTIDHSRMDETHFPVCVCVYVYAYVWLVLVRKNIEQRGCAHTRALPHANAVHTYLWIVMMRAHDILSTYQDSLARWLVETHQYFIAMPREK